MYFRESHVHALTSQTNVYSSCLVPWPPSKHSLLVASLQHTEGHVLCFNYQPAADGELQPCALPIQFLYIPPDAEIVSIDAFCPSSAPPVVGITLVKTADVAKDIKHFLNIYGARLHTSVGTDGGKSRGDGCERVDCRWKEVAEDWQACDLSFTPLKLTHVLIDSDGDRDDEVAFLLSGSDCRVHLFRSMPKPKQWREDDGLLSTLFPELGRIFGSAVTSLTTRTSQSLRFTAVGCDNGQLALYVLDTADKQGPCLLKSWNSDCFDGPVTSLCLYRPRHELASLLAPTGLSSTKHKVSEFVADADGDLSLMVGCAIEMAAVFSDIESQGLSCGVALPNSDRYDSVLCVCCADLDWDGEQELIVATYGQRLLVYKQTFDDAETTASISGSLGSSAGELKLVWERTLGQPIYNVFFTDLIGDGLPELVVVTLLSIHIFQHDLTAAASHCTQRLHVWADIEHLRRLISARGETPCV